MANVAEYVRIILASEFKAKAFNDADKAVNKLNKNVKNLAKGFGVAFGASQLARFSKTAVKAFAADDAAARALTKTLDNLGLTFADPAIKTYIAQLEKQFGILDDQLRPAYQRLVIATGDWQQAQTILNTALDISAATGRDLDSVTTALSRAYLGNTTALSRLGTGLSKAELAGSDFATIQEKLNKLYGGQAALAADTYQGSLNKLTVAMENFKEAAGKGIIEGLTGAGGTGGLNSVVGAIERAGLVVGDLATGLGRTANILGMFFGNRSFGDIRKQLQAFREADMRSRQQYGGVYATQYQKQAAALAKKQADNTKKQLTATKALTKAQSDALKEKKLASIFDQEQIQIMAALQGKITDEERKRLELMLAVQQGNVNEAQRLANELASIQGKTSILAQYLRTLPDARNPFESWGEYLKALEEQIRRMIGSTPQGGGGGGGGGGMQPLISTNVPNGYAGPGSSAWQERQSYMTPTTNVVVTVEGGDELTTLMRYKIAEASSSGSGVNWSQTVGAYDR